jgi:hypothetical protein
MGMNRPSWIEQTKTVRSLIVLLLLAVAPSEVFGKESRSKNLDFEDEVVEGVNRRPLDSLATLANDKDKRKNHLYSKRFHFRAETEQTLREMGFRP